MKTEIISVLAVFSLAGCTTGEKMGSIRPGMTRQEVVAIIGKPDGFSTDEQGREYYRYTNHLVSGWGMDRGDYEVVFQNGRVVSYGATAVRPNQNRPVVVVPLPPIQTR